MTTTSVKSLKPAMLAVLLLVSAAAVTAAPVRDTDQAERYQACLALVETAPAQAIERATQWRGEAGGGVPARHCLALAYARQGNYAQAATALAATANAAEAEGDPQVAELWGQAGNAALLAEQPQAALGYLEAGIAVSGMTPVRTAALLVDRARAAVELHRDTDARADLQRATGLDPSAAEAWLLRATLARRDHELARAERFILQAGTIAPGDADIGVEAGNIAAAQGKLELARAAWTAVAKGAPGSAAADAATRSLAANPGQPQVHREPAALDPAASTP